MSWVQDSSRDTQRRLTFSRHKWIFSRIPGAEQVEHVAAEWHQWWVTAREPERHGFVHKFVRSWMFSLACQIVILFNTAFVFMDTNYQIDNMKEQTMPGAAEMEIFFGAFYCIELTLKFLSHGRWFFIGDEASWNWFDTFLVSVTVLDLVGSMSENVSFARSFRILKVVKVLRVVRVLQFFTELRLMINCVLGSIVSLFWCIVMICFVMFLFAVFFTQAVTQYMKDVGPVDVDVQDFPEIDAFFGNVQISILTLFMSVTGGEDWLRIYLVLKPVGDLACVAFLAYIFVFLFSIWNVIMSVFVEKGIKLAQPDTNHLILETRRKQAADKKELEALFHKADFDSHHTLTQVEFQKFTMKPEFREFLQARGIDIKEARTFFNMISETIGDRNLDVGSIVRCCLGIKGFATSVDLHILRYEVREALRMVEDLWQWLSPEQTASEQNSRTSSNGAISERGDSD